MNATVTAWVTEFPPMNGSDQDMPQNISMETLISVSLMFIIALVGLAGNAVVLWLLGFRMQRNTFSVYILNLAGADFLFLCCQILHSMEIVNDIFYFISIYMPNFFITVFNFAYIAGLSFLSVISTERCLSILWPIWYRCHRHRHMSAVMCALLWALSLLLNILDQISCSALYLVVAGWLIFLFVLLSGSSLTLVTRLLCGSQRVQLTRSYVTVMFTVLVFLLCGLPWGIFWFLLYRIKFDLYMVSFPFQPVAHVLSCVNSCANPIIYFFIGSYRQRWRKRRQSLKLVLERALQVFPEGDEHGGSLPQEALEMSGRNLSS